MNLWLSFTQSAVQTVSAARQTSRRASAVFVCGANQRGRGYWGITASPNVPGVITAGTVPASVRTLTLFDFESVSWLFWQCNIFTAFWTHSSFLHLNWSIGPVICCFPPMLNVYLIHIVSRGAFRVLWDLRQRARGIRIFLMLCRSLLTFKVIYIQNNNKNSLCTMKYLYHYHVLSENPLSVLI